MASQIELINKFTAFPTKEHATKICGLGQGENQCRYLTRRVRPNSNGFLCEKSGEFRKLIDYDAERGNSLALGDNCDGLIGFIDDNQKDLKGLSLLSQSKTKGEKIDRNEGVFNTLIIKDRKVTLGNISKTPEDQVEITVSSEGITFLTISERTEDGVEAYQKETILFEKPPTKTIVRQKS